MQTKNPPNGVSVGITVHNEEKMIPKTLRSILNNTLWKSVPSDQRELLVCANNCTDGTVAEVKKLQKTHKEIRLIEEKKGGNANAKNILTAAMSPRSDAFFFFDGDVLVKRTAMERLWDTLRTNPKIDLVGAEIVPTGAYFPAEKRDPFVNFSTASYRERKTKPSHRVYGGGYAIRPGIAKKIKFRTDLQGGIDYYLSRMVGFDRVCRVPNAHVIYREITDRKDSLKRGQRYGYAEEQFKRIFPREQPYFGNTYRMSLKDSLRLTKGRPWSERKAVLLHLLSSKIGVIKGKYKFYFGKKPGASNANPAWEKTVSDRRFESIAKRK